MTTTTYDGPMPVRTGQKALTPLAPAKTLIVTATPHAITFEEKGKRGGYTNMSLPRAEARALRDFLDGILEEPRP